MTATRVLQDNVLRGLQTQDCYSTVRFKSGDEPANGHVLKFDEQDVHFYDSRKGNILIARDAIAVIVPGRHFQFPEQ